MSENSKIEWTDHSFNPWIGCQAISPGCANCYAAAWANRYGRDFAGRTRTKTWSAPVKWNAAHAEFFAQHGRRQRVFCASLADVFDNAVDPQWRADLFALIEATPSLDWLLLTKRIGNVARMVPEACDLIEYGEGWMSLWGQGQWPDNVWLGATIVNQEEADRDIPKLLALDAKVRFLSMEPLLGPVDLSDIDDGAAHREIPRDYWTSIDTDDSPPSIGLNALTGERWQRFGDWVERGTRIDWVIAGGESGPGARPMHPDWARDLRDQCAAAVVPFLFKQWGEWTPGVNVEAKTGTVDTAHLFGGEWIIGRENLASWGHADDEPDLYRIGKKAAGRLFDGVQHDGYPEAPRS